MVETRLCVLTLFLLFRGKLVADKEEITVTSAFNKDKGVIR